MTEPQLRIEIEMGDGRLLTYLMNDYRVCNGFLELWDGKPSRECIPFAAMRRWWVTDLTALPFAAGEVGSVRHETVPASEKAVKTAFAFWGGLQMLCEEVVDSAIRRGATEAVCYIPGSERK